MAKPSFSTAIKRYGTDSADAKRRILKAGAVTAVLDNGALRYISFHGAEVLRGIAFLVRDKNWGTYAPAFTSLKVKQARGGFTVSYSATCKDADQSITYSASIEAQESGHIIFKATGVPDTDFLTNRTGFVVLHPLDGVVGSNADITHTDGKRAKFRFPKFISPGQPLFEIRSLTHQVAPGLKATVLMEGNKFEMEDHRNWMDASYKTYVCSLLDPWPYTLKKAVPFTQSITVSLQGKPAKSAAKAGAKSVIIDVGGVKGRMPQFGIGVPMSEAAASVKHLDLIAAAKPAHLICQIDGRNKAQAEAANNFRLLAEKTGAPVHLEIVLPAKADARDEMSQIADQVRKGGLRPAKVIVTQMHDLKSFQPNTPRPWGPRYEEMAKAARHEFPDAKIGGGMLSYFTELNRKPVPQGLFEFVTHSVCPIVHAADDVSVMETLESLPSIFASARNMIGKTPYHLGPSGIPARDNPYGAAVSANPGNGRVCLADMDPRQRGLFAAAWNVGLASALVAAKLDSAAFGATTGPQGVIYTKSTHPQPGFEDGDGLVFPAFHVLREIFAASDSQVVQTVSGNRRCVEALSWRCKSGTTTLVANLTSDTQKIQLNGVAGACRAEMIDDASFNSLVRDPLQPRKSLAISGKRKGLALRPYGTVIIRW